MQPANRLFAPSISPEAAVKVASSFPPARDWVAGRSGTIKYAFVLLAAAINARLLT